MKFRHLAAWFSVVALLGLGATFIRAQPPQRPHEVPVRVNRDQLRAEIVKLRTEVEMLRFDYELARDGLKEDVKTEKALKMAGGMMQSVFAMQSAINEASAKTPGEAPRQTSEQDRRKKTEEAKKAEQEEKREEAELAAAIAERKKELARLFALWAKKQLDLEDAERNYRETFR